MPWVFRSSRRRDDDGWLDVLIFRDPGAFKALYYLWHVFRGTHLDLPSVFHRRVKAAFVTADETVPTQIDGDPGGVLQRRGCEGSPIDRGAGADGPTAGWTVEIVPQCLRFMRHRARL